VRYISGSATVHDIGDSATVHYIGGAATVHDIGGYATVRYISDSATVHVHGPDVTIKASDTPVIWLHVDNADGVEGGVQLRAPEQRPMTVERGLRIWGMDGDTITLYKAVDDNLKSGYGFEYPIGEVVECDDWDDKPRCGGGLHLSPHPIDANKYMPGATRFLE